MNMNEEDILKILSKKEMRVEELKEKVKDEKLNVVLEEMEDSGLIFLKKNQNYSITLLGKILALGLKEVYEKIVEKKDLFDFFRTRIPSIITDEVLLKFKFCEDFQVIGKPDMTDRKKEIMGKVLGTQPYAEKEMYASAPDVYKPTAMHIMAALKKRPKMSFILPEKEYKESDFIKVVQRVANWETRIIDTKNQYMGLLDIDNKFCFFGFRDLEDKPGWDALISTKDKECIEWVKENFEYMWDKFARKP